MSRQCFKHKFLPVLALFHEDLVKLVLGLDVGELKEMTNAFPFTGSSLCKLCIEMSMF